jgi:HlyD family secretion protein
MLNVELGERVLGTQQMTGTEILSCELEQYGSWSRCKWKWYCKIKDAAKVEVDAYLKNNLKVVTSI